MIETGPRHTIYLAGPARRIAYLDLGRYIIRMRRTIAHTLICFLLSANLAWAADLHGSVLAPGGHEHATTAEAVAGMDSGHDGGAQTNCDHCCHGAAHYVGVPHEGIAIPPVARSSAPGFYLSAHFSCSREPPLPPPNA